MASNRISVELDANDGLTPVLDRMLDKIREGTLQGALLGKAFDAAFDLGSKAIGGFLKSLEDASEATVMNIKTVGALSSTIGQSFEVTDRLNNKIIKGLAEQAAVLPGTTDDYVKFYRAVSDNVANASKEINGGVFSADKFEKQITQVSSKFTVLGGKLTAGQNIKAFESLMGGRSLSQLSKLEYFIQNRALLKNIKVGLSTDFGGKDIKDLTSGARLQVVTKALDMTLTDDTVKRLSNTLDSYKESLLSNLFDPTVGLFGWLRDVDGNLENGVQTAYQGMTDFVGSIIGDKGILTAIGAVLNALGFKFADPMAQIRYYSMKAANFFNGIAAKLQAVAKFGNLDEGVTMIQGWFIQAPIAIASWALKNTRELMNMIRQSNFGEKVGSFLATMVNGLAANLATGNGGIIGELLGTAGYVSLTLIKAIGSALIAFVSNLSPQTLITASAIGLLTIGVGALMAQLGAYLATLFAGSVVIPGILAIFPMIGSLFLGAVAIAGPGLVIAAIAAIALLGMVIVKHWGEISQMAGEYFNNVGQLFSGLAQIAIGILTLNTTSIVDGIKSICSGIMDLVNQGRDAVAVMTGGKTTGQASADASLATSEARYQAALAKKTGSNFAGFMPSTGIGGLLDAVLRESASMPSGSNVTIANSSEAVLTTGQQSTLAGAIGGRGGSANSFSPTINVYGSQGQDVGQLANMVMAAIQEQFNDYSAGMLA